MNFKVPVTIIIFNRPETINSVLRSIKEYRPTEIFIIADGPRKENLEDRDTVQIGKTESRRIN